MASVSPVPGRAGGAGGVQQGGGLAGGVGAVVDLVAVRVQDSRGFGECLTAQLGRAGREDRVEHVPQFTGVGGGQDGRGELGGTRVVVLRAGEPVAGAAAVLVGLGKGDLDAAFGVGAVGGDGELLHGGCLLWCGGGRVAAAPSADGQATPLRTHLAICSP